MAHTTLTLTASGRLPGALSGTPSKSTSVFINSGVTALAPLPTSGFTCYNLSCLGNIDVGLGKGRIVAGGAGQAGLITTWAGQSAISFGASKIERTTGTTYVATGARGA